MKDSSRRFAPIKRIAEKKEKDAAVRFGRERRERDEAQARLQELRQYHQEYMQRYTNTVQAGGPAPRLRDYQHFIDKLERAIVEQERILERHQVQCEQAKQVWSDRYTDKRAIGNVMERKQEEEERQQSRKEQRQLDDRGPRRG
jgi:flagellar protein FliJ